MSICLLYTSIEREITVSEGTKYIYIYAYTQNAPVYITDIEVLGLYSLYADAKIQVTAEEITSEVNKKVNSDDFGTLITQNAYNVRIAFNKGSSYMQFDSTAITMYTGTITDNQKSCLLYTSTINGTNVTQSVDQVDKIMKAWNVDASQTGNLLGLLTAKAQETGISVDTLESNVLDNNAAFKEMGLSLPQAINLMAQFDANGVDSCLLYTSRCV